MAQNNISYLNRNYNDYKQSLIELTKLYYPDVFDNLNDASVGAWLIELLADIGDNLNYHIDKSIYETTLDNASEMSSILDIARSNGLKIPFKKAAMVEVELSCRVPIYQQGESGDGDMMPDESYCPRIVRGTKFSNGTTTFELMNDVDFKEGFNEAGIPNRQIIPMRNSNNKIVSYTYKKLALASASQLKIYKKVVTASEVQPFMEVLINDHDVIGVESIIIKDGTNLNSDPTISDFYREELPKIIGQNGKEVYFKRYYEVENLIDQERFGIKVEDNKPVWEEIDVHKRTIVAQQEYDEESKKCETKEYNKYEPNTTPFRRIAKGEWKPLKEKFITEYDNDWNMKVIFGCGMPSDGNGANEMPTDVSAFNKWQMSKMLTNEYLGVLPPANKTMYVLYRTGGGAISNIAKGTLTNIISLHVEIPGNCSDKENGRKIQDVRTSIAVTNTTPSYGGKDAPTTEEIKNMIKYNFHSQNRCVTLKDYLSRIDQLPPEFGSPFRYNATEENNKIVIYTLGLDENGNLQKMLSEVVAQNIQEYLSRYKMLNDFVEITSGKIINIAVRATIYIDETFNTSDVVRSVIDLIYDYFDINKRSMGEDIFVGDLQKEISLLRGVVNLVKIRFYNKTDKGYSSDVITQQLVDKTSCCYDGDFDTSEENEIDLVASDFMLFSEANSMFEIKNKNSDISVVVKKRANFQNRTK